eukprot:11166755-Lingulodinium_polyedra.AAC.1
MAYAASPRSSALLVVPPWRSTDAPSCSPLSRFGGHAGGDAPPDPPSPARVPGSRVLRPHAHSVPGAL